MFRVVTVYVERRIGNWWLQIRVMQMCEQGQRARYLVFCQLWKSVANCRRSLRKEKFVGKNAESRRLGDYFPKCSGWSLKRRGLVGFPQCSHLLKVNVRQRSMMGGKVAADFRGLVPQSPVPRDAKNSTLRTLE